jgi:hypothetical protein
MAGSRLWKSGLSGSIADESPVSRMQPLRLFSLQLLVGMVGTLQKCGEVWITGIPGG